MLPQFLWKFSPFCLLGIFEIFPSCRTSVSSGRMSEERYQIAKMYVNIKLAFPSSILLDSIRKTMLSLQPYWRHSNKDTLLRAVHTGSRWNHQRKSRSTLRGLYSWNWWPRSFLACIVMCIIVVLLYTVKCWSVNGDVFVARSTSYQLSL